TSDVGKEWWFAGGGATEKDGGAPRRKRRIAPVENRSTASLYKKVEHRETSGACRHSPRRLRKTTAGTAALSAITAPPAANTIKAVAPTAADQIGRASCRERVYMSTGAGTVTSIRRLWQCVR